MIMIPRQACFRTAAREEMSDRPKLIYLARRHPSIEQASFAARWRQHGRLGMSLPRWRNIWRYAQCDALPWAASPMPLAGECDGVGLVWYRSDEARARHVDDGDRAVLDSGNRAVQGRRKIGRYVDRTKADGALRARERR
jgi:hypothetical protein